MKKVLLIEDDTALRENTAELLELSDYEVTTAANGKIGIQEAKMNTPDIIVCDIMMPEMDGYAVLENLSKDSTTRHVPFIFLSAKTERQDIRKGMDLGADDYLTKPFDEKELINAIESRLAKMAILKENGGIMAMQTKEMGALNNLEDLKEYFLDEGDVEVFKAGETVYEEGKHSNYVYLIERGVVKNHRIDQFGKELITGLHKAGDFFGYASFANHSPYQESATAIEEVEVYKISKEALKDLLEENHHITFELINFLTDNLSEAKDQLLEMAYSSVRKKTANTILKFIEKLQHQDQQHIKISRSDLASVAGIATESLIRALSSLKKEGLIDIEGRTINVLDKEGLLSIE
ncbi:response regulator [Sungkyunkwania multivorans]|uniref:Response regulator n=1 Tax=Sungkyunkwania multivorans TaxID=1173618 RepID=A0ABW3D3U7_9FLAO